MGVYTLSHILRNLFNSIAFYFSHRLVCPDTLVVYTNIQAYIYIYMPVYLNISVICRNIQLIWCSHMYTTKRTGALKEYYIVSTLTLLDTVLPPTKFVCIFTFYSCNHYQHVFMTCWNFFYMAVALLDELNSVRLHIQTEKHTASPCMLVHCSTGVGRSGVVMLSDVMRKCLENNEVCQNRILSVWIVRLSS